jgi:hypothetical protein
LPDAGKRVQGSGKRVQVVVVIVVDKDYDNDWDNDGRSVDDYGDENGLRGETE